MLQVRMLKHSTEACCVLYSFKHKHAGEHTHTHTHTHTHILTHTRARAHTYLKNMYMMFVVSPALLLHGTSERTLEEGGREREQQPPAHLCSSCSIRARAPMSVSRSNRGCTVNPSRHTRARALVTTHNEVARFTGENHDRCRGRRLLGIILIQHLRILRAGQHRVQPC